MLADIGNSSNNDTNTDPKVDATKSDCASSNNFPELEIDNLPNRLTLFRILLVPLVVSCLLLRLLDYDWIKVYYTVLEWVAALTFAVAAITDGIDGYIARKRNIITVFGSFLDPVADKFLTISSLIMLQALGRVPALIVIILILRELYITSLRLLASTEGLSVPVNSLGKWKTITQMVGVPMLMVYQYPYDIPLFWVGKVCIYIASILSLHSCVVYSIGLVRKIKVKRRGGR
ncbi:MAG: CDP-diacylglycerol--glycerol-3-phosphate 3-phosphatidyltransferase [Oligoflexia bacterium]|nr:CDP-diacylglycerol--glycerol-3-phosphate 3-phosphatidyltransferase [Oligoflexia bacterium]